MTEKLCVPANVVADNVAAEPSPNPNKDKAGTPEEILGKTRERFDKWFGSGSNEQPKDKSPELGDDQGSKGAGESIKLPIGSLFRIERPDGDVLFVVCLQSDGTNQTGLLISPVRVSNFVTDKPEAIESLVNKLTLKETIMRLEGEGASNARVRNRFDVLTPIGTDEAGCGRLGWINNILDRFDRAKTTNSVVIQNLTPQQTAIDATAPAPTPDTGESGGGDPVGKRKGVRQLINFILGN